MKRILLILCLALSAGLHSYASPIPLPRYSDLSSATNALGSALAKNTVGEFNVMAYGAVGDGVTDDTTAIQNALNAAGGSSFGGEVVIPFNTFKTTSTLLVTNKLVTIRGVNASYSRSLENNGVSLKAINNGSRILFMGNNAPIIILEGHGDSVLNVNLQYNTPQSASNTNSAAIWLADQTVGATIDNVVIGGAAYGIYAPGSAYANRFEHIIIEDCSIGYVYQQSGELSTGSSWYFQNLKGPAILVDATNVAKSGTNLTVTFTSGALPSWIHVGMPIYSTGYSPAGYNVRAFITSLTSTNLTVSLPSDPGTSISNAVSAVKGVWAIQEGQMVGPAVYLGGEWSITDITTEIVQLTSDPALIKVGSNGSLNLGAWHVEDVSWDSGLSTITPFVDNGHNVNIGTATIVTAGLKPGQTLNLFGKNYDGVLNVNALRLGGNYHTGSTFNLAATNSSGGHITFVGIGQAGTTTANSDGNYDSLGAAETLLTAQTAAATYDRPAYTLTTSGFTATLAASPITWVDGSQTDIGAQTIGLYTNATQYIGLDVFDGTIHNYPHAWDMGKKWIAQVVTGGSGVTSIKYLTQDRLAPPHRFEAIKQKIIGGTNMIKVAIIGDSISLPYPGYTTNWWQGLFTQSSWFTNLYFPHTATWYATNYAIGTQTPVMGMTMIGSEVESPVVGGDNALGGNFGYADPYYSDLVSGGGSYTSPVLEGLPDLLIVGYYNPTANFLPWLERIVQRARAKGIAVIVHDTNPDFNVSSTQYIERCAAIRQMADQHGAMYLSTWDMAYEYHVLQGNSPSMNADTGLHPNDTGSALIAKAMRSVLAPYAQRPERISASPIMANLPSGTYSQYTWPWNMEIEFALSTFGNSGVYNTNIAYADVTQPNKANPAIIIGNRSTSTGALAVPAGSAVNCAHPCALCVFALVDGNAPFSWSLAMGSTTVSTGTYGGSGGRPAIVELASVDTLRAIGSSAYNHGVSDYWVNAGWKLSVTTNTAVIYGMVFGAPARIPIPMNVPEFIGAWDTTNTFAGNWQNSGATNTYKTNNLIMARATDNAGDYIRIPFVGAGIQVLVESGIVAGRYKIYLDGRQITTINGVTANPLDAYLGAARFLPINVMAQPLATGDANFFSGGSHVLKVVADSVGGSASGNAPTNMLRRFKYAGGSIIGPPEFIR